MRPPLSRREFMACGAGLVAATAKKAPPKALVAVTLDLEMSRNFPTWETTHWDYEKGNLNAETKKYAVEAARRGHAPGGPAPSLRARAAVGEPEEGMGQGVDR